MDTIADMLTCVRNANMALKSDVDVPHSKIKEGVARILKQEGYIGEFSVEGDKKKRLRLTLRFNGRKGIIEGIKRVSRPGLRKYVPAGEMPRVLAGIGTAIISTSRGIMTGVDARKENVGGEVICYVW